MDGADDANREVELQLATIETEDGDHHGQEHGTPTPSSSPTLSPDGALRLRAPGKGLVLGQRPAPPASGSNAQNRRGSTPVTSSTRGRPPLSAAAKLKNKNKAVTTCVTVDETSALMDVDGDHVVISDDEDEQEEDVVAVNGAGKRKKTSNVWLEMKEVKVKGEYKARCNYCHKDLTTGPKAGTKHLADHLKICTLKKLKTKGGNTMSQSSLMMNAQEDGNVSVESYTFDQEVARRELGNMLVLHDYPLSIVDHAAFRKFVHALQPLFKLHTRNTYRWNSTFEMLEIALPYRSVFECAKQTDKQYEYLPTDKEWEFAADVVDKLKMFYEITTLFSGTKYVTANIYFPKICEIKMKMRQWGTSTNPIIKNMAEEMTTKFDKYWTDIQDLMGMATLLDPQYKRYMLTACIAMLYGIELASNECIELVDDLVARLHALLEEYEVEENEYQPCEELISSKTPAIMNVFNDIVAKQSPAVARLQGEIEMYMSDALVPYIEKFNVLDWWKVAGTRYPTLRKVARDVFAIPVTTVASESAFSTSGRILSEHRSHLTPDMLEALMCSQDWLRNKYKDSIKGDASFWTCLQDIQEGMEDLAL
ncbi:hypothetical protein ACQ4PT_012606 [Festuca glaucescens]